MVGFNYHYSAMECPDLSIFGIIIRNSLLIEHTISQWCTYMLPRTGLCLLFYYQVQAMSKNHRRK